MKALLLSTLIFGYACINVAAQTDSTTGRGTGKHLPLPPDQFFHSKNSNHPGAVTITGICLTSVGPAVTVAGFINSLNGYQHGLVVNQNAIDAGYAMEYAGLGMLAVGIGMTIGGAIHDHNKRHHSKVALIAPSVRDFGIAYNF